MGDAFHGQNAEWYYTLSLLREGKLMEAKDQAQRIADDSEHLYKKLAGLLVQQLD